MVRKLDLYTATRAEILSHVHPHRLQNSTLLHRGYVPAAVLRAHVRGHRPVLLHYGRPQVRRMVRGRRVLCPAVCAAPDMSCACLPGCLCLRPHTQGVCPGKCCRSIQGDRPDPVNVWPDCPGLAERNNIFLGGYMNRYVVAQINPHVKNFYVVDTLIPEDSFCKRFYGKGDKRDQPFKTRAEAQTMCNSFNN